MAFGVQVFGPTFLVSVAADSLVRKGIRISVPLKGSDDSLKELFRIEVSMRLKREIAAQQTVVRLKLVPEAL